jgi:endonuclease/exonuclease/phosphatase family metal-dependent hydrolase
LEDQSVNVKFRLVVINVGAILLSFSPLAPAEQGAAIFKVLTYNLHASTSNDLLQHRRLPLVEAYVRQNNIDLFLAQEVWNIEQNNFVTDIMAQDLGMDTIRYFENGISGIKTSSIAILAKKNLKLRNPKFYKLPHSASTLGDGDQTWIGFGIVNMLIGATITLASGEDAFVWTAHFHSYESSKRIDQARFALRVIQDEVIRSGKRWSDSTVILGGDLNAAPDSEEIQHLLNNGFQDIWTTVHPNHPGRTFVSDPFDGEYNPITHGAGLFPKQNDPDVHARIDYILAHLPKAAAIGATRALTSPVNGVWLSDHYGVLGSFDFNGTGVLSSPDSDTDMAKIPPSTILELTNKNHDQLPPVRNIFAFSERGLTVLNNSCHHVDFYFNSATEMIYTESHTSLWPEQMASFAFFGPGRFPYRMVVTEHRTDSDGTPWDLTYEQSGEVFVDKAR